MSPNSVTQKNYLLLAPFFFLAILPAVPEVWSARTWLFLLSILIFWTWRVRQAAPFLKELKISEVAIPLFIFYSAVSFFWADHSLVGISDLFRQLTPYVFLLVYFLFYAFRKVDIDRVVMLFHFCTLTFIVANLLITFRDIGLELFQLGRITYANFNFVVPLPFLSLCLAMFARPFRSRILSNFHILLCAFVVLACGYRSQLILTFLTLVVLLILRRRVFLLLLATLLLSGLTFLPSDIELELPFLGELISRFAAIGNELIDGSRNYEREYAMQIFLSSPLFGAGLGTPVPVSIIFANDPLVFYDIDKDYVRYVHNIWMYMLMDLGGVGLLIYVSIYAKPVWTGFYRQLWNRKFDSEAIQRFSFSWIIIIALIYSTVEAVYRQVHFNFTMALFLFLANESFARRNELAP